jgi:hypothetical protein
MLGVLLRIGAGVVDDAVPMIRRRIERVELQGNAAHIDDVVLRPGWDKHRETGRDRRVNAIEHGLARPFLHPKELIELVNFHPDFFAGFQRHDYELRVVRGVEHLAKVGIRDSNLFDILDEAFHGCLLGFESSSPAESGSLIRAICLGGRLTP